MDCCPCARMHVLLVLFLFSTTAHLMQKIVAHVAAYSPVPVDDALIVPNQ